MKHPFRKPRLASIFSPLLALALLAGGHTAALADVKAGVDAWTQGDYTKAIQQWQPLADAGDPDAQFNMGQAYKLGRGVPTNMTTALDYYRKAAVQGHLQAEDIYGLLLFQQNRRVEAMPYIERSAERGDTRAQYLYGIALFNGDLAAKDWPRAYAMMTRAATANLPQATASLTQMNNYMPESDRLKGVAMAREMEKQAEAVKLASAAPANPMLRQPSGPVKSAELPPSQPATTAMTAEGAKPKATTVASPPVKAAAKPATPQKAEQPAKPASDPKQTTTPALAKASSDATKAASTKPAPPTAVKQAPQGKWRVQLGAFSEKARAETQWKATSAKIRDLGGLRHFVEPAGSMFRLLAGPLASREDAERICAKVKATGADCLSKSQ